MPTVKRLRKIVGRDASACLPIVPSHPKHTASATLSRTSPWPCMQATRGGVALTLSVVPGASRTELAGLHGDALRLRLAAPPVDGKANEALLAWLAEALGLPRRQLTLSRGATSRRKQVLVDTAPAGVQAWLDGVLGER